MLEEYVSGIANWLEAGWLGKYMSDPYVLALAIVLVGIVLSRILLIFLERVVKRLTERTKTKVDDIILAGVRYPLAQMVILLSAIIALKALPNQGSWQLVLADRLLVTGVYLLAMKIAVQAVGTMIKEWGREWAKKTESHLDDALMPIAEKTADAVIIILGLVMILGYWGLEIGPLLAGMGIAGIAVGFALQGSLSNIFGGISLMLDSTFKVGEKIQLESGELGTIDDVGLRSTKLKTADNEIITVPNGLLANSRIRNFSKPDCSIRVVVDFGVEYGSDVKKVKQVVMEALDSIDGKLKEPVPEVVFLDMGESALKFSARFWIPHYDLQGAKKVEAVEKIHDALNKNRIGLPFPTRTVYLKR